MKIVVPVVIVALVVLAAVGVFAYQNMQNQNQPAVIEQIVETQTETNAMPTTEDSAYTDGTYEVVGTYVSPGGPREINVTLTLQNGVVTATEFEGLATDATSKRFQGEFADGYEAMVVGKNIDEISLTKVSGSSLTPKGFMDAVEKIKVEAQA